MGESGAVSRKQIDVTAARTEGLATALAPRIPLVVTTKHNWSFVSELCPLALFCPVC